MLSFNHYHNIKLLHRVHSPSPSRCRGQALQYYFALIIDHWFVYGSLSGSLYNSDVVTACLVHYAPFIIFRRKSAYILRLDKIQSKMWTNKSVVKETYFWYVIYNTSPWEISYQSVGGLVGFIFIVNNVVTLHLLPINSSGCMPNNLNMSNTQL